MERPSKLFALARLYRLSIALTPMADVLTGYVLFSEHDAPVFYKNPELILACFVSMALFCFGASLNDLIDTNKDKKLAPHRPIPSGRLTKNNARMASIVMAILSLGLAAYLGLYVFMAASAVFLLVCAYNIFARRSDTLGVINLGLIRGADLFVGAAIARHPDFMEKLFSGKGSGLIVLLYAFYGICLSYFALGERGQKKISLKIPAWFAAGVGSVFLFFLPNKQFLFPGIILWLCLALPVYKFFDQENQKPEELVGHFVSGFFLLAALIVLSHGRIMECGTLWILYFISRGMSRRFPPS